MPTPATQFRLAGEVRVIVEEQGGKRTKHAGFAVALNGKWVAGGGVMGGRSVVCDTLDQAVAQIVGEYEAADRKTGGI